VRLASVVDLDGHGALHAGGTAHTSAARTSVGPLGQVADDLADEDLHGSAHGARRTGHGRRVTGRIERQTRGIEASGDECEVQQVARVGRVPEVEAVAGSGGHRAGGDHQRVSGGQATHAGELQEELFGGVGQVDGFAYVQSSGHTCRFAPARSASRREKPRLVVFRGSGEGTRNRAGSGWRV